jgi:ribosomal protein L37AE/L43A
MTREKYYEENCPTCHASMHRRKRDLGKDCRKCLMRKIGLAYGKKRRANPTGKTQKEHDKKSREKRFKENPFEFRLKRTLSACKTRAKRFNVPFSINLQDLIDMFPADNLCPVLKVPFVWGTKKDHNLSPSVDRIIPELGYVKGNIKFISYKANRIKNDSNVQILKNLIEYMESHHVF